MNNSPHNAVIHLTGKRFLELRNARGTRIQCHRGTLWITQEKDGNDVILETGKTFEIERQGLTLVSGFDGAAVSVVRPGEPAFLSLRATPHVV
ncbi:MAG: DUF2917 domain-containing protein [Betaproteobacteria bacterium]|nr:DUF2917 domain-containing protein [Betaproteobacteria bacterium]